MPLSDYAYAGPPDVGRERFIALAQARGATVSVPELGLMYDALVAAEVRPLPFLAHWNHESGMGTNAQSMEARYGTRNPGAVRTPENPAAATIIDTDRGHFARYDDYATATADWAARLRGPKYEGVGLTTVQRVIPKYAPASDQGNQPVSYVRSVLGFIGRHLQQEPPVPTIVDDLTPVNHAAGRAGTVRGVVLHITDGDTAAGAISWFKNPASEVSAHYVVDRDGTIYRVVRETDTAWANGKLVKPDLAHPLVTRWVAGHINPNGETVSIEAAGKPSYGWSAAQVAAIAWLVADVTARHGLPMTRDAVLGHYQLDSVNRARCPSLTAEQWATIVPPGGGVSDDATMEAVYQQHKAWLQAKRFKGRLMRDFYSGVVLVCDGGVVTPTGVLSPGRVMDDWQEYNVDHGTLIRY